MQLVNPKYNFFRREYWFGQVDTRPLSVFRILFGLILIKDAFFHFFIARWFYADNGIAPLSAMHNLLRSNRFSLMDAFTKTWMVDIFFALWVVVLILYIVGYRTRLITIINFIMIISIHERDIFVLNGADTVIRALAFWQMFLPLGDYYSIDAIRGRIGTFLRTRNLADLRVRDDEIHTTYAFPLRMMQIQFAMIYLFTSILKLPGFAWQQGTAIYYAMQVKSLVLPTGDLLLQAPLPILKAISYQSIITELVFFWFVFSPIAQPYLRITALILGTMLHLGIAGMMSIGNFSAVMISGYLFFFEPEWITWLGAKVRHVLSQSAIPLPAGANPLWLLLPVTATREVAVDDTHMLPPTRPDEWWMIDDQGDQLTGVTAWRRAIGHLPLSKLYTWLVNLYGVRRVIWGLLSWIAARLNLPRPDEVTAPTPVEPPVATSPLLPQRARMVIAALAGLLAGGLAAWAIVDERGLNIGSWNAKYAWWAVPFTLLPALTTGLGAAAAFGWLGPAGERIARIVKASWRTALTGVLILAMCTVIWWNLTTIDTPVVIDSVPTVPHQLMQQISLWQAWDMFSPFPSTIDGWIVIPGKFEDGSTFDLLSGKPVTTIWPREYWGPSVRWIKYFSNISRDKNRDLLAAWGSYYCDYYNNELKLPKGHRLATLEIHYYFYRSHEPGAPENPMQDDMLWRHWCFPEYQY